MDQNEALSWALGAYLKVHHGTLALSYPLGSQAAERSLT